jgi:prepilin-type N-terminal cleavage/methylation domain-containing protein
MALEITLNSGTKSRRTKRNPRGARGFTLIELVVAVAIILLITAMAMPVARNMIRTYRLNAASSSVAGVIQSTRYQAIMVGCPYTLAFTKASQNYQMGTQTITGTPPACATTFSNVGTAVPWASTKEIAISADTTLQFNPSGTVQANSGALTFDLTLGTMKKSFTVSGVGNVDIVSK